MTTPAMADAFAHHVWASMKVIDACRELGPEELATEVPGTYGSIARTLEHLVGSDAWYLLILTADPAFEIDEGAMDLEELRDQVTANGEAWSRLLARGPDPDEMVRDIDDEYGYVQDATMGIRLAQALHHGTDHRSQICTALTSLGIEPPGIDVWDYGESVGRVVGTVVEGGEPG
jgi:uncharacterized damage-inducible protein DinB